MAYDAFISYSSTDKLLADAACTTLEAAGIRCWIAPRDISPGVNWSEAIVDAIDHSSVMVLIFSSNSNASPEVGREIHCAVRSGVTIMPLRIEPVEPTGALAYYMRGVHWLDALTPPLEQHLQRLAVSIRALLQATPTSARSQPEQTWPGLVHPTISEPPTATSAEPISRKRGEKEQRWWSRWFSPKPAVMASAVAAVMLVLGLVLVRIVIRPQENRDVLTLSARPFQATSESWVALATIDKTDAYCVWVSNRKEEAVRNALSKCGQDFKLAGESDRECLGIARWGRQLYWSFDVSPRQAALAAIRKCELAVREACGLHLAICPDGTGQFHSEDWPNHP